MICCPVLSFRTGEVSDLTTSLGVFVRQRRHFDLVTAKHVEEGLGNDPYYIRFNRIGGGGGLLPIDLGMAGDDLFKWFAHPIPSVDLAVLPFPVDVAAQGVEAVALKSTASVKLERPMTEAGCGDMCHVIGLFAARAGEARNIAVVHTGHIAAMVDSKELIPTMDQGRITKLEGYLVEISNLSGLSGALVFVRGGVELNVPLGDNNQTAIVAHKPELRLLGVWAGSWDKPISPANARAPVGIGIVTPAHRLLELLDSDPVAENRRAWVTKLGAAKLE